MVITNVNQVVYRGDGVTTAFPFTFRIIDATDIKLLLIDADGTETDIQSDYFVDTVNNTVHYPGYAPGAEHPEADQPAPVQTGQKLVIYRELPITQEKDLGDKWPFFVIELALDKLTMILQQIYGWWGRTLKFGVGWQVDHPDFDATIPVEAGKTWRVNDEGTGFVATGDPDEAVVVANEAVVVANNAVVVANNAKDIAAGAKTTAEGIAATAQEAKTVANNAKDIAAGARNIAEGIDDTAQDAKDIAQTAMDLADDANDVAAEAKTTAEAASPTGVVQAFAGSTTPQGWLLCDGSAVSRTNYAALYAVIGTTYGAGNGSTTFNLPNLVDKFVEGSATAGTVKSAGLPNITGSFNTRCPWIGAAASGAFAPDSTGGKASIQQAGNETANYNALSFSANKSNSIYGKSTTVQPPALTMRYIIKY